MIPLQVDIMTKYTQILLEKREVEAEIMEIKTPL